VLEYNGMTGAPVGTGVYARGQARRGGYGTVYKSMGPPATLPRTAGGQIDETALRRLYLTFRPEDRKHLTKQYIASSVLDEAAQKLTVGRFLGLRGAQDPAQEPHDLAGLSCRHSPPRR
jgi:hypothetical protein